MIYWLVISTPLKKYESQFTIIYHSFLSDIDDQSACAEGGVLCSSTVSIQVVHPVSGKNASNYRWMFSNGKINEKPRENMGNSWKFRKKK